MEPVATGGMKLASPAPQTWLRKYPRFLNHDKEKDIHPNLVLDGSIPCLSSWGRYKTFSAHQTGFCTQNKVFEKRSFRWQTFILCLTILFVEQTLLSFFFFGGGGAFSCKTRAHCFRTTQPGRQQLCSWWCPGRVCLSASELQSCHGCWPHTVVTLCTSLHWLWTQPKTVDRI